MPSGTAATVEKPLGAHSTHVVTAASPKVARGHIYPGEKAHTAQHSIQGTRTGQRHTTGLIYSLTTHTLVCVETQTFGNVGLSFFVEHCEKSLDGKLTGVQYQINIVKNKDAVMHTVSLGFFVRHRDKFKQTHTQ